MKHFLDINKTDAAELRTMIDHAAAMKTARAGRPRGAADDEQPHVRHFLRDLRERREKNGHALARIEASDEQDRGCVRSVLLERRYAGMEAVRIHAVRDDAVVGVEVA